MKITDLINFSTFEYNWDRIETIPEFKKLKKCEQNPKWHGEGNAWIHTKLVCEEAVKMCKQNHWEFEEGYASLLLTSALFHDIGKGTTTHQGKDGRWHSYGHELESEKITRRLLWDAEGKFDFIFREKVCSLVRYHMMPLLIFDSKTAIEKVIELSREVPCWKILIMLKTCDVLGTIQEDEIGKQADLVKLESLEKLTSRMDCLCRPFGKYLEEYKHFVSYQTKKHINVAVLIGISGAGKSTVSDMLVNYAIEFKNGVVVSRDDLRVKLGFCNEGEKAVLSKHNEQVVTDEFNEIVLKAAKEGKPIVLDNLNIKRKYRDGYKSLLSNYDVSWTYYYVEAPTLGDNIERRRGQVDKETLVQMINDIEMPTADEYDSIFYMKTHPGCTIQGE